MSYLPISRSLSLLKWKMGFLIRGLMADSVRWDTKWYRPWSADSFPAPAGSLTG